MSALARCRRDGLIDFGDIISLKSEFSECEDVSYHLPMQQSVWKSVPIGPLITPGRHCPGICREASSWRV
jgi:hypothetical protein